MRLQLNGDFFVHDHPKRPLLSQAGPVWTWMFLAVLTVVEGCKC